MTVPMSDDFDRAKDCAFWYLNRKRYTKKEIIEKLVSRDYSREVAERVADHLEEREYIDDRDYARRYILDAVKLKKHGIRRIKTDLSFKGITADIVDETVEKTGIDCNAFLPQLLESKAAGADITDEKQKSRVVSFLVRRGFSYRDINDAICEYVIKRENTD